MMRPVASVFVVLTFMSFLAAQVATGFMRKLFEGLVYPRAMRGLDAILDAVIVAPFGRTGGAMLLLALGLIFAVAIMRRSRALA